MNSVIVLLLVEILFVLTSMIFLRRLNRLDSSKSLTLILFLIAYPLSGIAHLSSDDLVFRGYFDLIPFLMSSLPIQTALVSVIIAFSIMFSVFLQPKVTRDRIKVNEEIIKTTKTIQVFMIALVPFSIFALDKINAYLSANRINRVLFLDGGLARYFYIAIWIVWPILFFGTILINSKFTNGSILRRLACSLVVGTFFIFSLSWTGSRLLPLLFFFVFIQTARPFGRRDSRFIIFLTPIGLFIYVYLTTINRISELSYGKNTFNLESLLDWQIGRFSILGATLKYNSDEGLAFGSTFVSALSQAFQGFGRLLGFRNPNFGSGSLSISQEYGLVIFSDPNNRYLAPGLIVEVFRNFGTLGIIVFCIALPFIVTRLYRTSLNHSDAYVRVLTAYYMISFVFVSFLSSSESLIAYFFYYPLPIVLIVLSRRYLLSKLENSAVSEIYDR